MLPYDVSMSDSMDETGETEAEVIRRQAVRLEHALPTIALRLFTMDPSHPLAEMPIAQLRLCSLLLSQESPTMSQVAAELRTSVSAVTQLADRLERSGMVERITSGATGAERDRRARYLRLTERGRELMHSRRELRQQGARSALSFLSSEDRSRVLDALETLLTASAQVKSETGETEPLPDAETPENMAHRQWKAYPPEQIGGEAPLPQPADIVRGG